MSLRHCDSCRVPLPSEDLHSSCVSCLGPSHAETALAGAGCAHCELLPLAVLRSRLAAFETGSRAPPPKRQRRREPERRFETESTPAHYPRAPSPRRQPVTFVKEDQRPLPSASSTVSFGVDDVLEMSSSEEALDWAASEEDDTLNEPTEPRPLPDSELVRVLTKATAELDLEWSPPSEPVHSRLDEWFLQPGRRQTARQRHAPFFPEVHQELTKSWRAPHSTRAQGAVSQIFSVVNGADERGYSKLPPLEESVAAHLCPSSASGWRAKSSHPSKPCRLTSSLATKSYAADGHAASALDTMAVLQVYQAKLLRDMDESGPDPAAIKDLRSATDLALRATKIATQAVGRAMASLVVLERHLWLNLTDIKDADRVALLDSPVSPSGLFGAAVEGFTQRFTEAQKSSQAMRHFLPRRPASSSDVGRPKPPPAQRPKSTPPPQPQQRRPEPEVKRQRPTRSAGPPRRRGPRTRITLDPAPPPPPP